MRDRDFFFLIYLFFFFRFVPSVVPSKSAWGETSEAFIFGGRRSLECPKNFTLFFLFLSLFFFLCSSGVRKQRSPDRGLRWTLPCPPRIPKPPPPRYSYPDLCVFLLSVHAQRIKRSSIFIDADGDPIRRGPISRKVREFSYLRVRYLRTPLLRGRDTASGNPVPGPSEDHSPGPPSALPDKNPVPLWTVSDLLTEDRLVPSPFQGWSPGSPQRPVGWKVCPRAATGRPPLSKVFSRPCMFCATRVRVRVAERVPVIDSAPNLHTLDYARCKLSAARCRSTPEFESPQDGRVHPNPCARRAKSGRGWVQGGGDGS